MSIGNKTIFTLVAAGVLWLVAEVFAGSSSAISTARAESVRTTKRVRVMSRPRNRARVVTRVCAGKRLTVLARRGRWVKVRVNGRTGWITRSSASTTRNARTSARTTRRRARVASRSKRGGHSRSSAGRSRDDRKAVAKKRKAKKRSAKKHERRKREVEEDSAGQDDEDDLDDQKRTSRKKRVASRTKKRTKRKSKAKKRGRSRRHRGVDLDDDEDFIDEEDFVDDDKEEADEKEEADDEEEEEAERRESKAGADKGDRDDIDALIDGIRSEKSPKAKRAKSERKRRHSADELGGADVEENPLDDSDEGEDDSDRENTVVIRVAEAELMAMPSARSAALATYEEGERLTVIRKSESGEWIQVEDEEGESGWIHVDDLGSDGPKRSRLTARGGATLGYSSVGSAFASNGVGELANYKYTSSAASLSIRGDAALRVTDTYWLAVDARYIGTRAAPGIRFQNSEGEVSDIGFTNHDLSAGASLGYGLGSSTGMVLYGRLGYYLGRFDIHNVDDFESNLAMLPSEVLKGMTVGAHVDVPRLMKSVGVRVGADLLYPNGKREQYAGLEDGAVSKTFAAWATAQVSYQWKPKLTVECIYRYAYGKTDWTGSAPDSVRPHGASEATRRDVGHIVMLGVGSRL
jgi:uncharacterized protein YgiM (DUF1202 family)